ELLHGLLADDSVARVTVLGRRAPAEAHPKLQFQAVDFAALPKLAPVDECYIALGTTIKVAGSQQAFRAVDHDAVVNVAKAAKASRSRSRTIWAGSSRATTAPSPWQACRTPCCVASLRRKAGA